MLCTQKVQTLTPYGPSWNTASGSHNPPPPWTSCLFQNSHYISMLLNLRGKCALKKTLNNLGGPQQRSSIITLDSHFQWRWASAVLPASSGSIFSPGLLTKPPTEIAHDLQFRPDESRDHFRITRCYSLSVSLISVRYGPVQPDVTYWAAQINLTFDAINLLVLFAGVPSLTSFSTFCETFQLGFTKFDRYQFRKKDYITSSYLVSTILIVLL